MPEGVDGVTGATMSMSERPGRMIDVGEFDAARAALAGFRESIVTNTEPAASGVKGLETARTVQLSLDAMDKGTIETW